MVLISIVEAGGKYGRKHKCQCKSNEEILMIKEQLEDPRFQNISKEDLKSKIEITVCAIDEEEARFYDFYDIGKYNKTYRNASNVFLVPGWMVGLAGGLGLQPIVLGVGCAVMAPGCLLRALGKLHESQRWNQLSPEEKQELKALEKELELFLALEKKQLKN
jgi:hypothetical protein